MIREIPADFFSDIHGADPFLTRILSLALCYRDDVGFVRYYAQYAGGRAVSYLSDFDGRMTLFLTADSDIEEIESFVDFLGCVSLMYDERFLSNVNSIKELSGDVLQYHTTDEAPLISVEEPPIKEIYEVLQSCASESFSVPDYLSFLSDVTYRKNRGKCALCGVREDGALASCAVTVAESEDAVILGAVATRPEYRKRGYSRAVVKTMGERFSQERKVYVFSLSEKNTRFYEKSGFVRKYRFIEAFLQQRKV